MGCGGRACRSGQELLSLLQRLEQLERVETMERLLPALRHELINQLASASVEELGGTLPRVLAERPRSPLRDRTTAESRERRLRI